MDHPTVAAAFAAWEKRSREHPEEFATEFEKLAGTESEYGAACEPYFNKLVAELGVCLLTQPQRDSLASILKFAEDVRLRHPDMALSAGAIEILVGTWFKRDE